MANTEKVIVQVVVKGEKDLKSINKTTEKSTKSFTKLASQIATATLAYQAMSKAVSSVVGTFKSFEFQMAKTRAITGANDAEFKKLSDSAKELGRTTFFTASQVAELQTNYGKLGFTTDEILKAQEATIQLSTATGSDLARAATVAGATVRGFGLDASETQRVVDVMAVSFTSSAMDLEKWSTSMTKVAPIAKSAGFSVEDTAAMMSKLTDAGIEASISGTSLRNILLKMQDPNSELTKSFGKTIHSYDELLPAMKQFIREGGSMADVMEVVDDRQAAAFEQLLTSADATEELRDKMEKAAGTAKEMSDIIGDTLEGSFKRLTSATEGLAIALFEELSGKGLQEGIDDIAEWINKLTENAKEIADSIRWTIEFTGTLIKLGIGLKAARIAYQFFGTAIGKSVLQLKLFTAASQTASMASKGLGVSLRGLSMSIKGLIASTGIGVLVVLLQELAMGLMFANDEAEEHEETISKVAQSQKDALIAAEKYAEAIANIRKEFSTPLPVGENFFETNEMILAQQNKIQQTLTDLGIEKFQLEIKLQTAQDENYKKQLKERINDISALEEQGNKSIKALNKHAEDESKRLGEKNYKDRKKVLDDRLHKDKMSISESYLAREKTKEQFDKEMLDKEILYLNKVIKLKKKHNKSVEQEEKRLMDIRFEIRDGEVEIVEEITGVLEGAADLERAIFEGVNQDYLDGLITRKQANQNILDQTISLLDSLLQSETLNEEERETLEQKLFDLKMKNQDLLQAKNAETLQKQQEQAQQALQLMQTASDSIFTIMGNNQSKNTERETKRLEERKDAGLITQEEYEKGVEQIERKAFERKKRLDIAQAIINGALAMTKTAGTVGFPLVFAFSPFVAAMTAAQIAVISSQKYALGGMIEEFANGGMVHGRSHAQGGEKFAVGGRVVELEGGEAVINKRSTAMFRNQLSAMNAAGGGVKFADGGLLNQPSFAQQQFNALGQNNMLGAMNRSSKVVVVEADITDSQNSVSVIEADATI